MSTVTGQVATVSVDVGGQEIVFETGRLAKQADGAVAVRSGETMILATAVGRPDARPDADFFPLTVDVEERMYAAGKIPGGFFKREGRPTERAILTARMIDRPIRPLWPKGYRNEVQLASPAARPPPCRWTSAGRRSSSRPASSPSRRTEPSPSARATR